MRKLMFALMLASVSRSISAPVVAQVQPVQAVPAPAQTARSGLCRSGSSARPRKRPRSRLCLAQGLSYPFAMGATQEKSAGMRQNTDRFRHTATDQSSISDGRLSGPARGRPDVVSISASLSALVVRSGIQRLRYQPVVRLVPLF